MKLELTQWQRVAVSQLIGGLRGDLALLRKGGKILDALEKTGIPQHTDPREMDNRADIEIGDREITRLLKETVEGFQGWPMAAYRQVEDLAGQLDVAE